MVTIISSLWPVLPRLHAELCIDRVRWLFTSDPNATDFEPVHLQCGDDTVGAVESLSYHVGGPLVSSTSAWMNLRNIAALKRFNRAIWS